MENVSRNLTPSSPQQLTSSKMSEPRSGSQGDCNCQMITYACLQKNLWLGRRKVKTIRVMQAHLMSMQSTSTVIPAWASRVESGGGAHAATRMASKALISARLSLSKRATRKMPKAIRRLLITPVNPKKIHHRIKPLFPKWVPHLSTRTRRHTPLPGKATRASKSWRLQEIQNLRRPENANDMSDFQSPLTTRTRNNIFHFINTFNST